AFDADDVIADRRHVLELQCVEPVTDERKESRQRQHRQSHERKHRAFREAELLHGRSAQQIDITKRLLAVKAEEALIRLDLLDVDTDFRQELLIPVRRVAAVELIRLLMKK